jgi:Protein of unknown function (DUF3011)
MNRDIDFARRRMARAWLGLLLPAALLAAPALADDRGRGGRDDWHREERIACESPNGRYQLCQVAVRGNVRLLREHSRADCIEGRTWGWSSAGIWVDRGCRGVFGYTPRMAGGGYRDGYRDDRRDDWHDDRRGGGWDGGPRSGLRCESERGRTVFCPAPVRGNVVLTKQLSRAPCRYGDTWTFDRRGISVRDGCRAEFRFDARGW